MELSTRARRRLSTILALVLAAESVSAVSVAATSVGTQAQHVQVATPGTPASAPAVLVRSAIAVQAGTVFALRFAPRVVETPEPPAAPVATAPSRVEGPTIDVPAPAPAPKGDPALRAELPKAVRASGAKPGVASKPSAPSRQASKPAAKPAPKPGPKPSSRPQFSGTNHVWIPALGISKSVHWFPCDRTRPPDSYMYRWGCAGANNVYLMGHAYSVMKPLHDAYVSGRLKVGMKAYYAGADGKVHVYAVRWWRLTRPTTDAAWAWAAQSVPSMTLQTCVGADSQWRLMVRLVEVGG